MYAPPLPNLSPPPRGGAAPEPPVAPSRAAAVRVSGMWKRRALVAALAAVACTAAVMSAYVGLRRLKRRYVDWPRHELQPLVTPPGPMTPAEAHETLLKNALRSVRVAVDAAQRDAPPARAGDFGETQRRLLAAARGRGPGAPPLHALRPFNKSAPSNYYGVVSVSKHESATLRVASLSYFEVVIYSQPDWRAVFAEVNITETPLDFLPRGTYAVVVFSAGEPAKGSLEMCENRNRARPPEGARRQFDPRTSEAREEGVASTVAFAAPAGTTELLRIHSSPVHIWPAPVLTRVETVYAVVPESAVAVYVVAPAFGHIVEGEREHLAGVVHENNGAIVYRAVAQPPSLSGAESPHAGDGPDAAGVFARLFTNAPSPAAPKRAAGLPEDGLRVVSLTAVYPNICPSTDARDLHPKLAVFVYAPETRASAPTYIQCAAPAPEPRAEAGA